MAFFTYRPFLDEDEADEFRDRLFALLSEFSVVLRPKVDSIDVLPKGLIDSPCCEYGIGREWAKQYNQTVHEWNSLCDYANSLNSKDEAAFEGGYRGLRSCLVRNGGVEFGATTDHDVQMPWNPDLVNVVHPANFLKWLREYKDNARWRAVPPERACIYYWLGRLMAHSRTLPAINWDRLGPLDGAKPATP